MRLPWPQAGLPIHKEKDGRGYRFSRQFQLRCPQLEVAELVALMLTAKHIDQTVAEPYASFLIRSLEKVFLASIPDFRTQAEQIVGTVRSEKPLNSPLEVVLQAALEVIRNKRRGRTTY